MNVCPVRGPWLGSLMMAAFLINAPPARAQQPPVESAPAPPPAEASPSPEAPPAEPPPQPEEPPEPEAAAPPPQSLPPTEITLDQELTISASGSPPTFNPKILRVKKGQLVALQLNNDSEPGSGQSFNWTLVRPGRVPRVLAMGSDSNVEPGDILYLPDVLAGTRLVRPGEYAIVYFEAPEVPGRYPFISTIGGSWRTLHGTLEVEGYEG